MRNEAPLSPTDQAKRQACYTIDECSRFLSNRYKQMIAFKEFWHGDGKSEGKLSSFKEESRKIVESCPLIGQYKTFLDSLEMITTALAQLKPIQFIKESHSKAFDDAFEFNLEKIIEFFGENNASIMLVLKSWSPYYDQNNAIAAVYQLNDRAVKDALNEFEKLPLIKADLQAFYNTLLMSLVKINLLLDVLIKNLSEINHPKIEKLKVVALYVKKICGAINRTAGRMSPPSKANNSTIVIDGELQKDLLESETGYYFHLTLPEREAESQSFFESFSSALIDFSLKPIVDDCGKDLFIKTPRNWKTLSIAERYEITARIGQLVEKYKQSSNFKRYSLHCEETGENLQQSPNSSNKAKARAILACIKDNIQSNYESILQTMISTANNFQNHETSSPIRHSIPGLIEKVIKLITDSKDDSLKSRNDLIIQNVGACRKFIEELFLYRDEYARLKVYMESKTFTKRSEQETALKKCEESLKRLQENLKPELPKKASETFDPPLTEFPENFNVNLSETFDSLLADLEKNLKSYRDRYENPPKLSVTEITQCYNAISTTNFGTPSHNTMGGPGGKFQKDRPSPPPLDSPAPCGTGTGTNAIRTMGDLGHQLIIIAIMKLLGDKPDKSCSRENLVATFSKFNVTAALKLTILNKVCLNHIKTNKTTTGTPLYQSTSNHCVFGRRTDVVMTEIKQAQLKVLKDFYKETVEANKEDKNVRNTCIKHLQEERENSLPNTNRTSLRWPLFLKEKGKTTTAKELIQILELDEKILTITNKT